MHCSADHYFACIFLFCVIKKCTWDSVISGWTNYQLSESPLCHIFENFHHIYIFKNSIYYLLDFYLVLVHLIQMKWRFWLFLPPLWIEDTFRFISGKFYVLQSSISTLRQEVISIIFWVFWWILHWKVTGYTSDFVTTVLVYSEKVSLINRPFFEIV